MATNTYAKFLRLLPTDPVQFGSVVSSSGGFTTVELPGGNEIVVRGTATPGGHVFVRGGAVDSEAPSLPLDTVVV